MPQNFMECLKESTEALQSNVSVTENGAIGYKWCGNKLVNLNFKLSSMRNMSEDEIWTEFMIAYNENPVLSVVWLMFARDILQGCGERRVFRVIFTRLSTENEKVACSLLHMIPEYGRWDDLVDVWYKTPSLKCRNAALDIIDAQLETDLFAMKENKPISLLAKWLPSENTSSPRTVLRATKLREALKLTPREYRKRLSSLRNYLKLTESYMSANEWDQIEYDHVPSKAAMVYRDAFQRHDGDRYERYLNDVKEGKKVIHSGTLFPYEIVHAYMDEGAWFSRQTKPYDETLEQQWKALPNTVVDGGSTLVVVDGSGSMCAPVGNTGVTCHDVARSLGIYFSEKLSGPYHDSFITFSANPKLITFKNINSLREKLNLLCKYDECSNTNIEKTFDVILSTAVKNHLKQDEIPANILVISDLEFDTLRSYYEYDSSTGHSFKHEVNKPLFDSIAERWEEAGYKLPRLVFWNVCSRTGTIPMITNDLGVALVSGFSPNIASMVMSGKLDPAEVLIEKLTSERYRPVMEAVLAK